MTQFFVAITALLLWGAMVSAQTIRSCDLELSIKAPANNLEMNPGDTAWLEFTVTNNGPDAILASDTLWFWDKRNLHPFIALKDIAANATKTFTQNELGMSVIAPSGLTNDVPVPLCLKLVNQSSIAYSSSSGPIITFEDPDTANNWSCVNLIFKSASTEITEFNNIAKKQLRLYPNPATNQLNITSNLDKPIQVTVTNMWGVVAMRLEIMPGDNVINIHSLAKGMYLVRYKEVGKKVKLQKLSVW